MPKICSCCNQVLPETNEEKLLASEKLRAAQADNVIADAEKAAAQAVWEEYFRQHDTRGFWMKYPEFGMFSSVAIATAVFLLDLILPLGGGMHPERMYGAIEIYIIVALALGYFLCIGPFQKGRKIRVAIHNNFIRTNGAEAKRLGFETI